MMLPPTMRFGKSSPKTLKLRAGQSGAPDKSGHSRMASSVAVCLNKSYLDATLFAIGRNFGRGDDAKIIACSAVRARRHDHWAAHRDTHRPASRDHH